MARSSTAEKFEPFPDDEEPDAPFVRPNKGEQARFKMEARGRDKEEREKHEAAMRSEGLDPETGEMAKKVDKRSTGEQRTKSSRTQSVRKGARVASGAAREVGSDTSSLVKGNRPVSLSAGVIGLLGYAIGVNFLQGGWAQAKGWLGAKFVNASYTPAATSTSTTGPVGPVGAVGGTQATANVPTVPPEVQYSTL